jgi:hypothetical protein
LLEGKNMTNFLNPKGHTTAKLMTLNTPANYQLIESWTEVIKTPYLIKRLKGGELFQRLTPDELIQFISHLAIHSKHKDHTLAFNISRRVINKHNYYEIRYKYLENLMPDIRSVNIGLLPALINQLDETDEVRLNIFVGLPMFWLTHIPLNDDMSLWI